MLIAIGINVGLNIGIEIGTGTKKVINTLKGHYNAFLMYLYFNIKIILGDLEVLKFNFKCQPIKDFFYKYKFAYQLLIKINSSLFILMVLSTIIRGISPYVVASLEKKIVHLLEMPDKFTDIKSLLLLCCIVLFSVHILRSIFFNFSIALYRILGIELNHEIKKEIAEKNQKIPYYKFFDKDFLDLHDAVTKSGRFDALNIVRTLFSSISALFSFCLVAQAIAIYNWVYLVILITGFTLAAVSKINLGKHEFASTQRSYAISREYNTLFGYITNNESVKDIKVFNSYAMLKNKFINKYKEEFNIWKHHSVFVFKVDTLFQIISQVASFYVFWSLASKVLFKELYISNFIFYSNLIFSLQNIITDILENIYQNYTNLLFLDLFLKFKKTEEISPKPLYLTKTRPNNLIPPFVIELKSVSFKYPYSTQYVLNNISCQFNPGETVCIVGRNGSGKTTLINLILRLYEPTNGVILINNKNINEFDLNTYYRIFSVFFQETIKYHFQIDEYITFGNKNCYPLYEYEQKLKSATTAADAEDFIKKLPQQYSSFLTKKFHLNGFEPSGGQWQKLALARTFFSNKNILIFDEPTSSMDIVSEKCVYDNILKPNVNQTKIFISHKIKYIKSSQQILFLDNGTLICSGKHHKLITSNEKYKQFYDNV